MKFKSLNNIFLLVILFSSSCKKVLELQPAQSLSNQEALNSDESVKQVLIGAYDNMSVSSLLGGEVMRNSELYAGEGELDWVGTFIDPREIWLRDILVVNGDVYGLWRDAYSTINSCNGVISAVSYVDPTDQARVEGEAKCLRAWCYFELTRYFGQQYEGSSGNIQLAVPLILSPTLSPEDNGDVTRNTVEECYTQIIADLTDAENFLPDDNDNYANKSVAAALLARVYLQKRDYANARDAADRVIQSNNYSLESSYANCFNLDDNSSEDIFSIQVDAQDGANSLNTYFSTPEFGGRGDIEIQDAHIALYDTSDLRLDLFFVWSGDWRSGKWNNQFGNVNAIRLAEMYLIRAECNHRLSTSVGAVPLDDYNEIRTRAGMTAAVSITLDEILYERRLELAHEGHKLWDVKRLQGSVGIMPYNDPKMVYPIPKQEIDINPNLAQNPGY